MKKELPIVIKNENRPFNWNNIDNTSQYKTRMQRKLRRYDNDIIDNVDWKLDPGEKANRIWE